MVERGKLRPRQLFFHGIYETRSWNCRSKNTSGEGMRPGKERKKVVTVEEFCLLREALAYSRIRTLRSYLEGRASERTRHRWPQEVNILHSHRGILSCCAHVALAGARRSLKCAVWSGVPALSHALKNLMGKLFVLFIPLSRSPGAQVPLDQSQDVELTPDLQRTQVLLKMC